MDHITIQSPTPSLSESIGYYEKLGFRTLPDQNKILYTDGSAVIEINQDPFARLGFRFYKNSWDAEVQVLKNYHTVISIQQGYLTTDPNGIWVYLISSEVIDLPSKEHSFSHLGNFEGVSVETITMAKSLDFYQMLGFSISAGSIDSPWMTLSHKTGINISFMKPLSCPHMFLNPSLTYFNGKSNPEIIERIRNDGIPIIEEITHFNHNEEVDNIILRDPGGLGFFIFND